MRHHYIHVYLRLLPWKKYKVFRRRIYSAPGRNSTWIGPGPKY